MANYYTQFSVHIPYKTEAQRLWLLAKIEALNESEDGSPCSFEDAPSDHHVWAYTDESGDPERVADLVAAFQTQFQLDTPWIIEWANTCGKPRLDAFGGGAIAVYRGRTKAFSPGVLAERWIHSQARRAARAT